MYKIKPTCKFGVKIILFLAAVSATLRPTGC